VQEVLGLQVYDGKAADVWSCGVHLYVMLVGAYPFDDPNDQGNIPRIVQNITRANYSWPHNLRLSASVKDLVDRILVPEAERRITIEHIMKHPWYLQNLPDELRVRIERPDLTA
jgi:serine/threonine-protein kinase SRK2